MKTNEKLIVSLISGALACISILFFSHLDLEYISTWGVFLLEHIHHGELYNYAIDLFNMDYGTNYNLFQNVNVALWCLIPYLFSCITGMVVPMVVYRTLIKLVVAIIHCLCCRELYKVIIKLGFDHRKAFVSALLYFCSPVVIIHGIGIGQIDGIGILFFLISLRLYLEKRYWLMSIVMGLTLLSKFFMIMFYVPLLLLNFGKIKQYAKYLGLTITVIALDKILTRLLINNYSVQASVHNTESFYPRLFHISFNYESVVIMLVLILCGICLMIGNRNIKKSYHWLLFPSMIFFVFFLFVFWHPQWIIYVLPILLIMGCYVANEWEYLLFYTGFTMGFALHSIINCNTNWFNAILMTESILGRLVCEKDVYIGNKIIEDISPYIGNLGYTIFIASFALLILLFYLNAYKTQELKDAVKCSNKVWYVVMIVPVTIYIILLFAQNILF